MKRWGWANSSAVWCLMASNTERHVKKNTKHKRQAKADDLAHSQPRCLMPSSIKHKLQMSWPIISSHPKSNDLENIYDMILIRHWNFHKNIYQIYGPFKMYNVIFKHLIETYVYLVYFKDFEKQIGLESMFHNHWACPFGHQMLIRYSTIWCLTSEFT